MSILTFRRVKCDQPGCTFVSDAYRGWGTLKVYLDGASDDGRWYVGQGTQRTICHGCIIDRACRIFGHNLVPVLYALDHSGRSVCIRCQTYQAVAS